MYTYMFSRLGTQVSQSLCVYVFVLFGCVVLGLGFLSSLPLQLVCHTCVFSCTYGLWVGIYTLGVHACAQRSVSPICCGKECDCVQGKLRD